MTLCVCTHLGVPLHNHNCLGSVFFSLVAPPTCRASLPLLSPAAAPAADEAHYHLHAAFHGRTHDCTHTYNKRLSAFSTNKAKNLAHNKRATSSGAQKPQSSAATQTAKAASAATGGPEKSESEGVGVVSHTLELNHFADWDRDEFDRVMLPLKWRRDHGYEVQKVRENWCGVGCLLVDLVGRA